jgi:hypothetical protein
VSCSTASIVPIRFTSTATHSCIGVAAHEVDRPDLGLPLAPHERQRLAERLGRGCERLLQVALDAVLLQRRRLPHVVLDVTEHREQADLELVVALRLRHDEPVALVGHERRRRHPVERLVAARRRRVRARSRRLSG